MGNIISFESNLFWNHQLFVLSVIKTGVGNAISNRTVNATKKIILFRASILHDSKKHEKICKAYFMDAFDFKAMQN